MNAPLTSVEAVDVLLTTVNFYLDTTLCVDCSCRLASRLHDVPLERVRQVYADRLPKLPAT